MMMVVAMMMTTTNDNKDLQRHTVELISMKKVENHVPMRWIFHEHNRLSNAMMQSTV